MKPVLRVIIIEDSPDDALLMVREVERAGYTVKMQRVETAEALRDALAQGTWDLVLADYSLPKFSATQGLAILWQTGLDVPFIIVSGCIGEEAAVQLMRDGAADCVMKDHLSLLGPDVQRELYDADERKRKRDVEGSLADSEKRYRLLVENQTDLIVKTDPEGRILYASPTYLALFGKSPQELTGSSYQPLVHPDDLPSVEHTVADLFHPPHACRYEERAMTVNGWRWIEWTAHAELDSHGSVIALLGSGRDITERKRAEEAERESELRYRTFIDVTSDLVFLKDESFRYIMSNKANNAFLGRSETDVIGFTDFDLLPNDAAIACRSSDQKALAKGTNVISEETVGSKTYQTIKFPVPLSEGHVGVGGYVRDITERKKAEAEKEGLREQLVQSQKLEAIGQLAGGVAHDFNNLLTGILGNVAIIRRDLPASDPLVANLLAVETAARQAADLAKGLLTFSHKVAVTAVPLNMAETVDTTLSILKHSLPATMKIVLDIEQPSWNVLADLSQITQVILNLAVNARDAMQGDGTLTIRLRNEEVGEEYVRTRSFARTGEFVHLSVADTGPGIPPEIREHLFEPFYTTKPPGSGTGLGLSSVYGAVTQADGWVTADSPGGGGAIFDIFLPRCLDKPSTHTTPSDIPANVCSGTVLVAEDEPVVRAVAQALLTRSGCSVLTAEDGASALRALREHQGTIDLILLDMTMPGMTTREIVPALRALSPSVPILLTSGYVSGEEVRRFLEGGTVQGFLPKPYEVHELLDSVRHLLERS